MPATLKTLRLIEPDKPLLPVLFSSPHSGRTYPVSFGHAIDLQMLRQGEDSHVDALFAHVAAQGAVLLSALMPRTFIDVNRDVQDLDLALIDGEWPLPVTPTEHALHGAGLFWSHLGADGVIYARRLPAEEALRRIYDCWRPYHETIEASLRQLKSRFGTAYLIDSHSMPAVVQMPDETAPRKMPDFVLGDRDGTTCDPDLVDFVSAVLREQGYQVAANDTFKGVEILRRHSDPAGGVHGLQIEINRRLYMDEATRARSSGFAALKRNLEELTDAIGEFALSRIPAASESAASVEPPD